MREVEEVALKAAREDVFEESVERGEMRRRVGSAGAQRGHRGSDGAGWFYGHRDGF